MLKAVVDVVSRQSRCLGLLALLSVILPLTWLPRARVDNSIEVWLADRSDTYQAYQRFLNKYGNEEFIIIAAETGDPFGPEALNLQRALYQQLHTIPHVDTVLTLAGVADHLARSQENWQEIIRSEPLFQNLLLGDQGRNFGIVVTLERFDNPAERTDTLSRIEQVVRDTPHPEIPLYLAGTPVMNAALDRGSQKAARTVLPLAIALSIVILAVVLRSVGSVIAVLSSVGVTVIWTVGLLVAADKTLNMVTVVLPSLLFVLSLAGGIHLTAHFQSLLGRLGDRRQALAETLAVTAQPIALSAVTTAAGFVSLRFSNMQPVMDFGTFAALGMLFSLVSNLTILPALLSWLPGRTLGAAASHHWTAGWALDAARHSSRTLVTVTLICLGCASLAPRTRVEANVLQFFKPQAPIRQSYDFVADHLTGLYSVEFDFSPTTLRGKPLLALLDQFGETLAQRPQIAKVIHFGTVARVQQNQPRSTLMDLAGASQNPLKKLQQRFIKIADEQRSYRISVWVRTMSGQASKTLLADIGSTAEDLLASHGTYTLTGVVPLLNGAQQSLIQTQIKSFALAATTVLIMIGLFLRSFKALLAALLPNLLPILGLFAVMVLADIALDAATVMIAGIAIGIAADDTIHFLSHYRRRKFQGQSTEAAIAATFHHIGRSITFTTLVAIAAFVVLLAAEFRPIQYFGALASITMILAWCGDVWVLPACVTRLKLWDRTPEEG